MFQAPCLLRKEVIHPHLPVRIPCYDFTPITNPTLDGSLQNGSRRSDVRRQISCWNWLRQFLPCFPTSSFRLLTSVPVESPASGVADFRGVTGGVYKARERIHRDMLIRDY